MAKYERSGCRLADEEGNVFDAGWSRSGKRLIVSVAPRGDWDRTGQVELTPEQLVQVRRFLDTAMELAERKR